MKRQFQNRYLEAVVILFRSNPIEVLKFALATAMGKKWLCRLNFRGLHLLIRPNTPDLRVVRTILLGEFEEAMQCVSPRFHLIIDAGGYIGVSAIVFARHFPDARVIVLEPDAENYRLAAANCRAYPNIDVLNCALAATEGQVTLYDRGQGPWGFTTVRQATDAPVMTSIGESSAVTIGSLLQRYGANGVDLLKLDIEGAEYEVLQGRPEWVKRCGVIVAELHDRIRLGCTDVFCHAMAGREELEARGEKRVSVAPLEAIPTIAARD